MATFTKRGDSWRALIRIKGIVESNTCKLKKDAVAWAVNREAEINAGLLGKVPDKTFGQLLIRYRNEVIAKRPGGHRDVIRINALINGNDRKGTPPDPVTLIRLPVLNQKHIAAWRDRRLATVSPGSVLREWNLLSGACTKAKSKEWGWLNEHPMKEVSRPAQPEGRSRLISAEEVELILFCSGYERDKPPLTMTARVGLVFLFAIETGMRAGEICALAQMTTSLFNNVHAGGSSSYSVSA